MGIDNVDFAKVAWFRKDMYPVNPYQVFGLAWAIPEAAIIPPTSRRSSI